MSDDEGGFGDSGADGNSSPGDPGAYASAYAGTEDGDVSEPAEAEPIDAEPLDEEDSELGLDEDAAGTDLETDEDGSDADNEGDGEGESAAQAQLAHPQRAQPDPLLHMSNKPRTVHIVADELRVTDSRLQLAEAAYIRAVRAAQIARSATHFVDAQGLHDPVAIAHKELFERRCPLKLRRVVGTGPTGDLFVEEWNVREMTLPPLTAPSALGGAPHLAA